MYLNARILMLLDAEEEALRQHFEDCGNIENVRIIRENKTGLGKGFGYIRFAVG